MKTFAEARAIVLEYLQARVARGFDPPLVAMRMVDTEDGKRTVIYADFPDGVQMAVSFDTATGPKSFTLH